MRVAHRFSGPGKPYEGLTTIRRGKVDWTGYARFIPGALAEPLAWRKPQLIFVNSMSDLFHESLENHEIMRVFAVMAACPHLTFQVLTKRLLRARQWFEQVDLFRIGEQMRALDLPANGRAYPRTVEKWPLPNVWLGVSAEDQKTADDRIPLLLECPAGVRFVSVEPMIGEVDLFAFLDTPVRNESLAILGTRNAPGINWVIVGSESGPGARPMKVEWARHIVDQCVDAGVAVFTKQIANEHDRKGGKPQYWPPGNWPREFPRSA